MSGLNTSLTIALQSLEAQQGALDATSNNISNANTTGYTREIPVFEEASQTDKGSSTAPGGVILEGYQSVRDEALGLRIDQLTQQSSGQQAQLNSLQQVETYFSSSGTDIGSEMSAFFDSISQLETSPGNTSLRQAVLSAGQNLATAFHTTSEGITQAVSELNQQVTGDVEQINQLTQQIAGLNAQVAQLKASGQDGGTSEDQLDQLVNQLSKLTDVSEIQTESGITLTTGSGTALVSGGQSLALQTATGTDGKTQVLDSNGNNITSTIQNGDLGGSIQVRDVTLSGLQTQLDTLASQFAAAVNSANQVGFDNNGNAGQSFFNIPATVTGAAANISLAITDTAQIAASSDGSFGGGGNLANLMAVSSTKLSLGASPVDAYSNLVFSVGTATSNANAEVAGTSATLLQLTDQQSSISGVSLDEEATNLLRYQQAYEAAAKVISTIDLLSSVILNMGSTSGGY